MYSLRYALAACIPVVLVMYCSNSSGPEDIERLSGTFVLQSSSEYLSGYNLLEQEHTAVEVDKDLLVSDWFRTGTGLDSLYLSANLAGLGGGITRYDGLTAPRSPYHLAYVVNRFDIQALPLDYFVLCRGDSNYAHVQLDSAGVSGDTCRAYFSFTLNIDTYEREFTE